VLGAVRLRGIFDDDEAMTARDRQDRIHVSHRSMEMDRHDRLGARRDRALDPRRIHGPAIGIDIDKDRRGAAIEDGGGRRDEGQRNGDDLIAGSDAGSEQRQVQRRSAAVDGNAAIGAAIRGKGIFEGDDFRAENELSAVQDAGQRGIDRILGLAILRLEIEERDQRAVLAMSTG
jgi:hypothetical protein